MDQLQFSVVVPVYNMEKYLVKCMDSFINQCTQIQSEIILVDDGSCDSSGAICDSYAGKFDFINVIHQENGGAAKARNTGLSAASGEYIIFVDGDDCLSEGAFEWFLSMIDRYDHPDIITGLVREIYEDTPDSYNGKRKEKSTLRTGIDFMNTGFCDKSFVCGPPRYIYRRRFLTDNKLYFKEGIYVEDEWWVSMVFLNANSAAYEEYCFYNRYNHSDSSANTIGISRKASLDTINTCYEIEQVLPGQADVCYIRDHLAILYMQAAFLGRLERENETEPINKRFVFRNAYTLKNRLKAALFGLSPKLYYKVNAFTKSM